MSPHNTEVFQEITQNTIYLMGLSFMLGSFFTLLLLLLLDFMRRDKTEIEE